MKDNGDYQVVQWTVMEYALCRMLSQMHYRNATVQIKKDFLRMAIR